MDNKDKKKFAEIFTLTCLTYEKQVTQELMRLYFKVLGEYPIEIVEAAFMSHLKCPDRGQYWPKPADIISKISGTRMQLTAINESRAAEAWKIVHSAIIRGTPYQSLGLDDSTALRAIQALGGWPSLCMMKIDDEQWRRKEFIQHYCNFINGDSALKSLPGIGQQSQEKLQAVEQYQAIINKVG